MIPYTMKHPIQSSRTMGTTACDEARRATVTWNSRGDGGQDEGQTVKRRRVTTDREKLCIYGALHSAHYVIPLGIELP